MANNSSVSTKVSFKSSSALAACVELWTLFFDFAEANPSKDLAVWELYGSVRVSPMSSQHNEGANTFGFPVDDFAKEYRKLLQSDLASEAGELKAEFIEWITSSILKSFKSPSIQKRYSKFSSNGLMPFSILITDTHEWSLEIGPFTLLWKNAKGATVEEVFDCQARLRKSLQANIAKSRRLLAKKSAAKPRKSSNGVRSKGNAIRKKATKVKKATNVKKKPKK